MNQSRRYSSFQRPSESKVRGCLGLVRISGSMRRTNLIPTMVGLSTLFCSGELLLTLSYHLLAGTSNVAFDIIALMSALPSWLKLDWLKDLIHSPRVLSVVCVVGAMLLFLPSRHLDHFGLTAFRDEYRKWIGLATVVSLALLLTQLGTYIWTKMERSRKSRRLEIKRLQSLETLSRGEWFILQRCVDKGEQTIFLSVGDPHVNALCDKGLLVSARSGHSWNWPFTIPDDLWNHLQVIKEQIIPSDPEQLKAFRDFWHNYNDTSVFMRQELFDRAAF